MSPDHNNDAIKNVVWVLDVAPDAKGEKFEEHLQGKHAGEDNVADLQRVGQLVRLQKGQKINKGNVKRIEERQAPNRLFIENLLMTRKR